jgi:CheY-like chemotaxis protein
MPDGGELSIETEVVDVDESYRRTVPDASPGTYVRLTVTDTGCGIPEEVRGRIFEPFFTTKERGKGTGMGLAMVYGVVKNHGGFIRLQSEVGEGARFDVYLPASDEIPPPLRPRPAPARGTGRILFVDDEAVVRSVASDMLRSLGYEVTPAQSGDEAVDMLMRDKMSFDLAIIDLVMPGLEARECFRKLRVICPSLKAILSSGYGLNGKAQETVDEGMLGFIQKPYTLADLAAAVGQALNSQ